MAFDATFRHGDPVMTDYTPNADVPAGSVIVLAATGLTCVVTHVPLTNGVLGAVASGGGVYELINLNNAVLGAKVYWDAAAKKATTVVGTNSLFGYVVSRGAGGVNSPVDVLHKPYV